MGVGEERSKGGGQWKEEYRAVWGAGGKEREWIMERERIEKRRGK